MRITFNGVDYASPDEMPPKVRAAYDRVIGVFKDDDGDGVPDIAQRETPGVEAVSIQHVSITVNGKTYNSVEEMPPKVRRIYESISKRSRPLARNLRVPRLASSTINDLSDDEAELEWSVTTTTADLNHILLVALLIVGVVAGVLAMLLAWSWMS